MHRWNSVLLVLVICTIMCADAQTTETPIKFHPTNCKITSGGHEYAGPLSTTISNRTCQAWNVSEPHQNYYTEAHNEFPEGSATGAGNQCRNPTPDWHEGVWCYTTDPERRWEACNVNYCECKLSTDPLGLVYRGQRSTTVSGRPCQRWTRRTPHSHMLNRAAYFPDASVADASNYCRNPNSTQPEGPWCFTTDPSVPWEYCFVPVCYFSLPEPTSEPTSPSPPTTTPSPTPSPTPSRPTSPFHWPLPSSESALPPLVWNSDIPKLEPEGVDSSKLGAILGGIFGAILLILLIVGLVTFCRRNPETLIQIRNTFSGLSATTSNKSVIPPTPAEPSGEGNGLESAGENQPPSQEYRRGIATPSFDNPIYDQPRSGGQGRGVAAEKAANGGEGGVKQGDGIDRITIAGENKVSFVALGNVDFA